MNHQTAKPDSAARVLRFSTDGFPVHKRAAMFREYVKDKIVCLDHGPVGENVFMDGVGMTLPDLGIVANRLAPIRCARTRETMCDGNDNLRLVILLQSTSPAPVAHLGRDFTVEPGSAVVLSNCDVNAITFTGSQSRMISLNLARKRLRPLLHDFDSVLTHTIPEIAPLRLLASYIQALVAEDAPSTSELGRLAVAHIYDLAALAMGATRDAAEVADNRGLAAARLREIKSEIAASLSRDDLSVVEIARLQRVTPRYVQMLFEKNEGTTFTEFVRNARLNRAYQMLIDQRMAGRSIGTIAFEAGFSDLSYFNRAFRRRFGETPSDVRAASNGQRKAFLRPLPTTQSKDPHRQGRDDVAG